MKTESRVCAKIGIRYPIIQGPFGGGISSVALASTVSNLGGMGSFGANLLQPEEIKATVGKIRALTSKPFAINLWVPLAGEREQTFSKAEFEKNLARIKPYFDELKIEVPGYQEKYGVDFDAQIEALLEAKPPVASFIFGVPSKEILGELRKRNIISIGTATTVDEAVALDQSGVDLIVASGSEAGGHRAAFLNKAGESMIGTLALIPQAVDAVSVPVIAAGGISDGRAIVAAMALGAEAVQIGTAFLACHESGASEVYKAELVKKHAKTQLTRVFSGRYARGIPNRFMQEMSKYEADLPPYPIQNWFTRSIRKAAAEQGRPELISLWAGQSGGLVKRRSAAECFEALLSEVQVARESSARFFP